MIRALLTESDQRFAILNILQDVTWPHRIQVLSYVSANPRDATLQFGFRDERPDGSLKEYTVDVTISGCFSLEAVALRAILEMSRTVRRALTEAAT